MVDRPRRRGPTIIDVAARAGVSKSLVSLVMRGAPNVSDARRAAVLSAAAELGYRPNAMAQGLVRSRTFVVGVMLSDLHNPFFTAVVDGISAGAHALDYRALINTGDRSAAREEDAVETLLRLRTDGIVLAGTVIDPAVIDRLGREVPIVLASKGSASKLVDSVVTDDVAGAALAVDHLVGLGHRRIAHVSGGAGAGADSRVTGYRRAMRRHRLSDQVRVVPGAYTEAGGAAGATALWADGSPPTGIVAPNDLAAIGVIQAVEDMGLRVPDDVSVVGYDDSSVAALAHIGLTSVRQHPEEMGARAVELLVERIDRGRSAACHLVLEPSFTIRSTTAPPRR
ncbi:MAG: LacI family transcriptional regulator [Actinomycetota bacterium]|nr:LacI family transcriptional regulator [Actinomycetota bacterium]